MNFIPISEVIKFELRFSSIFWDLPPMADIFINDEIKFSGIIDQQNLTVKFTHILEFGKNYTIKIKRYNKLPNQCEILNDGTLRDQLLILEQVKIDDIDIKNIVQHLSYNEPVYPEPWASLQKNQGIQLEQYIKAETTFGHNGTWVLEFTSPFYEFLINWINGDLN